MFNSEYYINKFKIKDIDLIEYKLSDKSSTKDIPVIHIKTEYDNNILPLIGKKQLKKALNYSQCEKSTKENSVFNFNICKSIRKIGEHIISEKKYKKKYTAEFIIEIEYKNQLNILSCGTNNKLNFYDNSYRNIFSKESEDWIYNALTTKGKNNIFLASSKKAIYYYCFNNKSFDSRDRLSKIPLENNLLYLLNIESSYFLLLCENNVFVNPYLFETSRIFHPFLIYENALSFYIFLNQREFL